MRARRFVLAAAGLLLLGITAAGAATPEDLFGRANDDYEKGRYEEAASAYETILRYGVADPRVHYNLGNAYFKLERLGPAILNYERALRIAPGDQEARDNLRLARGLIRDRVEEPDVPYPLAALRTLVERLPVNAAAWCFVVVWIAAGGCAGALAVARPGARRRALAYGVGAAGIVVILAGGLLAMRIREDLLTCAIVMQDRVDVRSGPAADNTVLFTVHEGTRVEVRNRLEGWYQVSLPNALSGWVEAASVEPL